MKTAEDWAEYIWSTIKNGLDMETLESIIKQDRQNQYNATVAAFSDANSGRAIVVPTFESTQEG